MLALTATSSVAVAYAPSVADLDAAARAVGNRRDIAQSIGRAIFRTQWPAEVNQVSANEMDGHLIVGIRVWGVKFHHPMTRADFVDEIVSLARNIFSAAPDAEEIDFWAAVPIDVRKDEVVSGDLARPTSRTVTPMPRISPVAAAASQDGRAMEESEGVFWDAQWARDAFRSVT